jgi:dsDNA-binding SOS-regulon protein
MPIRLEYIVSNSKGTELKRFNLKTDAEAYDSVICAAEDLSLLIQPLQKKLSLTDEQIDAISEHLAFQSEEVKQALKQIKKTKSAPMDVNKSEQTDTDKVPEPETRSVVKKSAARKSAKKK